MNGLVLKSNGQYRHISSLRAGDYVVNQHGNPVAVKGVERVKLGKFGRRCELAHVTSMLWYEGTLASPDALVWMRDPDSHAIGFQRVDTIRDNCQCDVVLPHDVAWDMPDSFCHAFDDLMLTPSYGLGYLFGGFLLVGNVNKYKGVSFTLPCVEPYYVERLRMIFESEFDRPLQVSHRDRYVCIDDTLSEVFEELIRPSGEKTLPMLYRCKDPDYMKGLYDGILQSNVHTHLPLTIHQQELLYVTGFGRTHRPMYGTGTHRDARDGQPYLLGRAVKHSVPASHPPLWNLYVDCPTRTYVVNNMVVKVDY
jgi:hypothetical protein